MIAWITYGVLVGAMLVVPALALDGTAGIVARPRRFVWLGALAAVVALSVWPVRSPAPVVLPIAIEATSVAPTPAVGIEPPGRLEYALAALRAAIQIPLATAAALDGSTADRFGRLLWPGATTALLLFGAGLHLSYRRARRRWASAEIDGTRVRISPAAGPAVFGIWRAEIVLPAWLLGASEAERRLVLQHETEHVRARDPLLLTIGAVVAALAPWNPVAWWMLYRLRIAVEMDCDARILARGVKARDYGALLIEMAGRGAGLPLRAVALAASPSTPERRVKAMTGFEGGRGTIRTGALTVLGALALFTACEARMPTAAEVDSMDVAAVERQAAVIAVGGDMQNAVYYVDGRKVSAEEARSLVADRIAQVEVTRQGPNEPATIRISTSEAGEGSALRLQGDRPEGERVVRIRQHGAVEGEGEHQVLRIGGNNEDGTEPTILFIDGIRADPARLRSIRPDDIERIEVIKGEAAVERFGDPDAARGVIRITTRAGAARTP